MRRLLLHAVIGPPLAACLPATLAAASSSASLRRHVYHRTCPGRLGHSHFRPIWRASPPFLPRRGAGCGGAGAGRREACPSTCNVCSQEHTAARPPQPPTFLLPPRRPVSPAAVSPQRHRIRSGVLGHGQGTEAGAGRRPALPY